MHNFKNIFKYQKLTLFAIILMVAQARSDDYLKEAPSFLTACHLVTPDSDCLSKVLENVFTNWRNGIPGLKTVGPIDPFHVKKIHLEQQQGNVDFKADFKNVDIIGLAQTKIEKVSVSNEYNFKILVKIPKINIKSDYRIKGRLFLLNLDGTGPFQTEATDVEVIAQIKTKVIERSGEKFFDVQKVKSDIKSVSSFRNRFDNLFGGNPDLENGANDVINQNWQQLFDIMRPVLSETLDAIAFDRYKKILNYVPARFLIDDLP